MTRRRPSRVRSSLRIFIGCAALAGLATIPHVVVVATIAFVIFGFYVSLA